MAEKCHGLGRGEREGGVLDLDRCRELGFKIIEVVGGYSYPEVLYTLRELVKMIDQDAGGILFKRGC
jgi:hypothetical protein